MALKEKQLRRYARQILLSQVGGRGQQALLEHGAAVLGSGSAQAVAAAYVAAAGSPVRGPPSRTVEAAEVGFLFDAGDVKSPAGAPLESALKALNPDAAKKPQEVGLLAEMPAQLSAPPPWVLMGWSGGRGGLIYRTGEGCAACFLNTALLIQRGEAAPASVALGALGALVFQRCVLGLSAPLGGLWLSGEGELSAMAVQPCPEHAAR